MTQKNPFRDPIMRAEYGKAVKAYVDRDPADEALATNPQAMLSSAKAIAQGVKACQVR